jgi:hypothetical protein
MLCYTLQWVVRAVFALQVRTHDLHINASVPILAVEYVAPNDIQVSVCLPYISPYPYLELPVTT